MGRDDLREAKQHLIESAADADWLVGVGIGRVDSEVGLVVSVGKGNGPTAERHLAKLGLAVPVQVREIGPIRARPARRRG